MNRESMLFRTHEIKSEFIKKNAKDPKVSLFFHIKDDNFHKFIEIFNKYKIPIETCDEEGNSLFNLAVQCNSFNIIEFLISRGADVNTQNVNFIKIVIIYFFKIRIN